MRATQICQSFLLALLAAGTLTGQPARHVLVITSYAEGSAWNDAIVHGLDFEFKSTSNVEVDYEHLDALHKWGQLHQRQFAEYLHDKVQENVPDLIVASDDPAVRFVINYRGVMLPEVPVVVCGVNDLRNEADYVLQNPRPWMTGVLEPIDQAANVDLALHLFPDTRAVTLIGLARPADTVREIRARFPALQVHVIPVNDQPIAATLRQLEQLPDHTAVIFAPFSRDGAGEVFQSVESARLVAQHTHAPIFTPNVSAVGFGPIGGRMADPFQQGLTAASMALQILNGASPASIPIKRDAPIAFEFDYKALQRWHIPEKLIPQSSLVLNRPRTFRETHPLLVAAFASFLIIQSAVIGVLLVQRRRTRIAEAALKNHSQQLANSNYMLEQFAYVTAHDFQEPIRSVLLFAQLLARDVRPNLDANGQQAVDFIFENSRRLHGMVKGLLAWVKSVESPPNSVALCDAAQIWAEVVDRHRTDLTAQSVEINSDKLPTLAVHPHHMRELLSQLLQNALQHGRSDDKLLVKICAEREENGWKLTLYNSGPPIPETMRNRVFGVFRRLRPVDGSDNFGMGLAICRRIVDFYGGRIWVEPRQEHGCTFSFTIPDTPRPRARRPYRGLKPYLSLTSAHAHTDHRG